MNTDLLQKLANPVYDTDEAEQLMKQAGIEIVRLEEKIAGLNDYIHKLKDQNERLALDLGLKDQGYIQ
jgi:predicted nuclease with TOPRIM domain